MRILMLSTELIYNMNSIPASAIPGRYARGRLLALGTWLMLAAFMRPSTVAAKQVTFKGETSVRGTYDSNVYIQDNDPASANVAAAKAAGLRPVEANKASFVTSVLPRVGLDYKPCVAFGLSATYAPDIVVYHSAHSEDYVAHRGQVDFSGKVGDASWELTNTVSYVDGSREGPTFAWPGDIPAIGGIPLRDRRGAFFFRNSFSLTEPVGEWFFRPVAASYIRHFKTRQKYVPKQIRSTEYSYENYIDRQEVSGGLDVGYQAAKGTYLVLGYRYGRQDQFKGPIDPDGAIVDSPYDNAYHRILVGAEGSPASWVKFAVLFGPDLRTWIDSARLRQMYPAFNQNKLLYYWDASATFLPTKNDTVALKSARFERPAFSSFSMYEDIKTDLTWRRQFSGQVTAAAGFTLYIGDWQLPVNRNDWIYTPNASLTYAFTKNLSTEIAYSYDWVDSRVPASVQPLTDSREFTRHLATLGVKYTL
jgi:hypothetical protein